MVADLERHILKFYTSRQGGSIWLAVPLTCLIPTWLGFRFVVGVGGGLNLGEMNKWRKKKPKDKRGNEKEKKEE